MNKKFLSSIVVCAFVFLQTLQFLHIAKFGVVEHSHNGHSCEIYLHSDNCKITTASASTIHFDLVSFEIAQIEELLVFSTSDFHFYSRAPPFIS